MKKAPAVLGVSLVIVGSLGACTDEATFTEEERELLSTYKLAATPPPNPSNGFADDPDAAKLGKKIFFDARFSGKLGVANDGVTNGSLGPSGTTGKVSCYACHQIELGGADRRSRTPTSLGAAYGARNAPTVINAAHSDTSRGGWQLWDGRKDSLWALALGPMESADAHAGTRLQYAHIIYDKYKAEYEAIFDPLPNLKETLDGAEPLPDGSNLRFKYSGKPGQPAFDGMSEADKIAINRIYSNLGKAIEAYERRLVSANFGLSPFDRMLEGDDSAMTPAAIRGAKLFIGKAACNECHRGGMFTDYKFHNIGCPQEGLNVPSTDVGRLKGITLLKNDPFNRAKMYSDAVDDSHITSLVDQQQDEGSFRTPPLRNVAKTAPYMHNGVYTNLWDVVSHYNFGGGTGAYAGTKEAAIAPLLLTNDEMDDLVEFLRALSDEDSAKELPEFPEGLVTPPTLPQ